MTIQCFEQILYDDRVDEIVISDDCSDDGSYERLVNHFKYDTKVKLYRNETNLDCYFNKKRAIELASNNWCILADSDNIFAIDYLDRIFDYAWSDNIILTPSFAFPNFNFEAFSDLLISKRNVSNYVDEPLFETMLNASNFLINRQSYLQTWKADINPVTSDSIWFTYNWLKDGKQIYVVPNLSYFHRVHEGSHYKNNVAKTPIGLHENILEQLRELR